MLRLRSVKLIFPVKKRSERVEFRPPGDLVRSVNGGRDELLREGHRPRPNEEHAPHEDEPHSR